MTTRTPSLTTHEAPNSNAAHRPLGRPLGRTLIAGAVLAAFALSLTGANAWAQAAPAAGDPPGRVARLDYMAGDVTTEPAGATDWSYAQLNRPLTTGDQLWNDANARSQMHIGSTAVRMGPQTSVDVLNLDDSSTQLKVAQGTLSTRVRALPPGSAYEIDTPNLALGVTSPGDYRVDVAPDGSATTVTVRSGNVTVYGENGQMPISAGQQIRFAGTDLQQVASDAAPPPDAFDQWALARDAAEDRSVSARYVSRDIPGYQDLDANGSWHESPQYGQVWTPNEVPSGWAPYHDGHWVWQAPWGWTWVDDAPWGFAPYHYGRWAYVDDSWAWVPGPIVETAPPVYAPALVAFVGGGGGGPDWGVNLAIGGAAAAGVAWFALGPGEPWHPHWGDWSPRYYDRVNQTVIVNNYRHDVNITNITNVNVHNNTFVNYRVPGAVTAVPATAFVRGQPTSRFAQRVDPRQWQNARIQSGTPGIAPVKGSFGPNLRRADYRPPASLSQRQVVATRAPVAPPAFHDNLAQRFARGGGAVPGAGAPVVRVSAPAHAPLSPNSPFSPASRGGWPQQNVRVVPPHSPVIGTTGRPNGQLGGQPIGQPGRPGLPDQPGRHDGAPSQASGQMRGQTPAQMPGQMPNQTPGQPLRPGAFAQGGPHGPNASMPMRGQQAGQPGMPPAMANGHGPAAGQPNEAHGVPRPPQFAGRPEGAQPQGALPGGQPHAPGTPGTAGNMNGRAMAGAPGEVHQPSWMQPHAPIAQRGQPGGAAPRQESRQQAFAAMQQPRDGAPARIPQPSAGEAPRAPQPGAQPRPQPQAQPEQRADFHPQPQPPREQPRPQPQPQPQAEFHPQPQPQPREAPRPQPQPRAEFHPQPQPQPRPEFHPQPQPQPQPRAEFHPQPQPQPQPRAEFHPQPQPQPQPRAEFHPQPQPQPQPRAEFHPQPQPQPQPRPEPRPQPQPQPQPHPQAGGGGHDDRHHG
ncbi:DUF6600 domain-containing protein [Paraburkholderia sacchari]|uniref:DUF6600 domain-containing protein n=1 Tax=Paraburkholderia sacchari TaxID=159450 RepID=UPI001BCF3470|nr:DUF6600 domain-containing protein [Paraburkholderia sacchari]